MALVQLLSFLVQQVGLYKDGAKTGPYCTNPSFEHSHCTRTSSQSAHIGYFIESCPSNTSTIMDPSLPMDPSVPPPKGTHGRDTLLAIIAKEDCKPEWWKKRNDILTSFVKRRYSLEKETNWVFFIENIKDLIVKYLEDPFYEEREIFPPESHELRKKYPNEYFEFDLLTILQCLGEESPGFDTFSVETALSTKGPFERHFSWDLLGEHQLMCANCIKANRQYVLIIDRRASNARCARCGEVEKIFDFRPERMSDTYKQRFGAKEEGEQVAVADLGSLFSRNVDKSKEGYGERVNSFSASIGIRPFKLKEHNIDPPAMDLSSGLCLVQ